MTAMPASPAASIIVPCRNERGHIEACLRSILGQEPPPGGFEVLVADGMSNDGTREILSRLAAEDPRLKLIDNPGRIVSTGLNAALRASRGRVIIRMDAHTEYAPDSVRQCLVVLRETDADNVGGPWVVKGTGFMGRAIGAAFQSPFAAGPARSHDSAYQGTVDTVYLGCWPREVFDRIGLFDEAFVRNQDDEFNLRLTRAGGKLWQSPCIKSCYHTRGSLRSLFQQYTQYGYWKVKVIQKHRLPASIRHLIPATFVLMMLILTATAPFWPLALLTWSVLGALYITCNLVASVITATRAEFKFFWVLPTVFACYHIGYAWGFLRGVWDFIVLRRAPASTMSTITRTDAIVTNQESLTS
jgi:succinoglycan biosynthesis protein ExoA